ncbi:MAG: MauE/DoxX family redox-associated membrane protein [Rhodococcus sp. (in: high G+C Gram-positive bacteria)]|uniref:MauE/DoxX family redox-associated membrane protein n=1 Tax=Rhodococcus sp. TaxID=1831 RepID=UPI003BB02EB8
MWTKTASLAARLVLAAVWLISGAIKVADPAQTIVAVRAYQLLPEDLVRPVANTLPFLEIALGLLLLTGIAVRATAVVSGLVLAVLIGVIVSVWSRGLSIDCGCFGGGGPADVNGWDYLQEILRDLGFLLLAGWLVVYPRAAFALGLGSRARFSVTPQQVMAE